MALTINAQPNASSLHPVYNLLQYLVNSDQTTQENFKVIARIYTDLDTGGRQVGQDLKIDKYPGVTKVLAEVQRMMQSELTEPTANIQATTSDIFEHSNVKKFQVQFQEYFGTIPAATGTSVSGTSLYAINAAYTYQGWSKTQVQTEKNWQYNFGNGGAEFSYNNWLSPIQNNAGSVSGTTVTLSVLDRYQKIKYNQILPLLFRHDSTEARIQIQTFDSNRTLSQTGTISSTGLGVESRAMGVVLNQTSIDNNTYSVGSITLTSADKYLAVMYLDHSSNRNSVVKIYEIDWSTCGKYDEFEIHWQNLMGGWDSYVFNMRSEHSRKAMRNSFQRLTTTISGTDIVNDLNARKTGMYYTEFRDQYVLNSDNVPEWLKEGMADLYSSPLIYWRTDDGFIQIKNVTEDDYRFEQAATDRIFNIRFVFEIDHNNITQRS